MLSARVVKLCLIGGILYILTLGLSFPVFAGGTVTMEANTDRPGMDYKNFWMDKPCPECCRDACADDPNCKAYTYVKPMHGKKARCWLKKAIPPAKENLWCISGVKQSSSSAPPHSTRIRKGSTRETAIQSLMADPASRSTLAALSASAGMTPEQLTTKTLQGNSVSRIMKGQGIEDLPWDAGVKISLTKHNPTFFDPVNKKYEPVGFMSYGKVELSNRKTFLPQHNRFDYSLDLKDHIENDIFKTLGAGLDLKLPHSGVYMITVISRYDPICRLTDNNGERKLSMVRSKIRNEWVCLTTIYLRNRPGMRDCQIVVTPSPKPGAWGTAPDWIGGFTITRL